MSDFATWEPGETVICALCDRERGGADPPGNWIRHRPSHRRRIPIFGAHGPSKYGTPAGYLEFVAP